MADGRTRRRRGLVLLAVAGVGVAGGLVVWRRAFAGAGTDVHEAWRQGDASLPPATTRPTTAPARPQPEAPRPAPRLAAVPDPQARRPPADGGSAAPASESGSAGSVAADAGSAGAAKTSASSAAALASGTAKAAVSGSGSTAEDAEKPTPAPTDHPAEQPYGPGSAAPLPDGSAPGPEFTIKGNASSKLFHTPASPYYRRTKAEAWFRTPEDAERAGFTAWRPRPRS
ncbi:hypothetical protein GCM10009836_57340 [Pseudonocardia ailaonensis]|uniref:Uncharacterized protein n=1 Tax=Pseudonocardia ailaonensis TaxID=367279 RepID=A0ABN2NIG2_9PSEU